jgi:hypothetical protein
MNNLYCLIGVVRYMTTPKKIEEKRRWVIGLISEIIFHYVRNIFNRSNNEKGI